MSSDISAVLDFARRNGWSWRPTGGGHYRFDHPLATGPVFTASTPSDPRSAKNAIAQLRRALPQMPRQSPPEPRQRTRKAKPVQFRVKTPAAAGGASTARQSASWNGRATLADVWPADSC